jgi:hypothetical protein
MEEVFLCYGIQRKRFSSVVEKHGGGFSPLWNTAEGVFLQCGIYEEQSQDV